MNLHLPDAPRLLLEVDLRPAQGTRFQPTGFPDLGAATYRLADGTEMLLVESAQSVANRLEAACLDESGALVAPLRGLPYVEVVQGDRVITTSLLEAHRLNSAYIEKSDVAEAIKADIGYVAGQPVDRPRFLRAVCKYDPCSLLHGVFLESIAGVLRLPRALGGFIEARDVRVVSSGGVKNDRVMAGKDDDNPERTAREGFGNVPFHRDEYSAAAITAYFNLDLDQLRSYRLGPELEQLLFALALFKIQRFLDRGLRLRTACDLDAGERRVTRPTGLMLPGAGVLAEALPGLIAAAAKQGLFADPPVTRATFGASKPARPEGKGKKK
jgi:CRISPR-associated protein Csb1